MRLFRLPQLFYRFVEGSHISHYVHDSGARRSAGEPGWVCEESDAEGYGKGGKEETKDNFLYTLVMRL